MSADVSGSVAHLFFGLNPVFVAAHVEEALEGVLAGRVVGVEVVFLVRALLRLLDVVEYVMWDFLENFGRS